MARLYERTGRFAAQNGGSWPRRAVDAEERQKCILPCTPMAVVKIMEGMAVCIGLGRSVALYHRSSTIYQIH